MGIRQPSVIAVVGPTGSGKTGRAIALAERLDTEVLSADSMQFYMGMEIGTAAPTPEQLERAPHHFVSFLAPDDFMSASDYAALAREEVARLNAEGRVAVVCGGSGLYLSALIGGLFEGPGRDEAIRARLIAEAADFGAAPLMARLRSVDPTYAAALTSENDLVRIVRALEVHELTGRPFSAWHAEHQASQQPLDAVLVAPDWPREELYERINQRVEAMVAAGWVEEVRALVDGGYADHIDRLKALGFREIAAHLRGEQSLEEAIAQTQMHHRRYAKRQLSWFRNVVRVRWIPGDLDDAAWVAEALEAAERR
ncbi:MAG: hypothetical protein RLZZ303_2118 [Candidatus Hydrogenedentota bacterium]|jgi:tRNA dimethylallyltransferase